MSESNKKILWGPFCLESVNINLFASTDVAMCVVVVAAVFGVC